MGSEFSTEAKRRFEMFDSSPLTWTPDHPGKPGWITWRDNLRKNLGADPDGRQFTLVAQRMMYGRYYPEDAIEFFGPWLDEHRELRVGDRILQRARLFPFATRPALWAMTEVYVAEWTVESCTLGYVTTARHFGRGIWTARLTRSRKALVLTVEAVTAPQSWLFWIGIPIARLLQKRAWRRAVEEFRALGDG
jgi:hypothetical protein